MMALADRLARVKETSVADTTYINLASAVAFAGQMARHTNLSDAQTNLRTQISVSGENPPDSSIEALSFLAKKQNNESAKQG